MDHIHCYYLRWAKEDTEREKSNEFFMVILPDSKLKRPLKMRKPTSYPVHWQVFFFLKMKLDYCLSDLSMLKYTKNIKHYYETVIPFQICYKIPANDFLFHIKRKPKQMLDILKCRVLWYVSYIRKINKCWNSAYHLPSESLTNCYYLLGNYQGNRKTKPWFSCKCH